MQFLWLGNKSPKIPVLAVLPKEKIENVKSHKKPLKEMARKLLPKAQT